MASNLTPRSGRESGNAVGQCPTTNGTSPGGRVPPHDLAAERALLGAMLLTPAAVADGMALTAAADFYRPAHKHIFDAIVACAAGGGAVDTVTVAAALRSRGLLEDVGGAGDLVEIQATTPVAGNAEHYARLVADKAQLRRFIGAAGEAVDLLYGDPADVQAAIGQATAGLVAAVTGRRRGPRLTREVRERFDAHQAALADGTLQPVMTGFVDLDQILGGMEAQSLVVLGARPSMGKTALGLQIAVAVAATERRPVLFCSLEMGTSWRSCSACCAPRRGWPRTGCVAGCSTTATPGASRTPLRWSTS